MGARARYRVSDRSKLALTSVVQHFWREGLHEAHASGVPEIK